VAVDGGEWSALHHRSFTTGERAPAPIKQEAEWTQSQSGHGSAPTRN